jgi:hypothetical protein
MARLLGGRLRLRRRQHTHPKGEQMASVKDVEKVADDLGSLVDEMRNEVKNGTDFERLMQIADEISEHADNAAQTFNSVNDALMSRLSELGGGGSSSSSKKSSSSSKSQSGSSSS